MIEYIEGDLLKSDCDVIVHGCNCFHTMGGGIARQIRELYPEAYEADKNTKYADKSKLGDFSQALVKSPFTNKYVYIINAYTQYDYGRSPGSVYVHYDAIELVFKKIYNFMKQYPEFKIGIPKIGAGLAQGDWNKISNIINSIFVDVKIYVYEFNTLQELSASKINIKESLSNYRTVLDEEYKKDDK